MFKIDKKIILLGLVIVVAFIFRIFQLNRVSMYGDELTMVYDTYSILKTGHDQTGQLLPITFHMGEGRPGGYIYASVPFVALFGPSIWGVRALSIISGLGIIVLVYLLSRKLFSERVGILSAILVGLAPWAINLSRGGFEANFALFLALLGVLAFLLAQENSRYYLLVAISWGLTIHTYPTYKLVLPLVIVILLVFVGIKNVISRGAKVWKITALVILVCFGLLTVKETLFSGSEQRFVKQNIFTSDTLENEALTQNVVLDRKANLLPPIISKIFHNRPVEYFKVLVTNYFNNFSTQFLFTGGDGNPRHNMTQSGLFYWIEIVTILIGLLIAWMRNKKVLALLLGLIAVTPLATMLMGNPHLLRSSFMFPFISILSAVGLEYLLSVKRNLFSVISIGFLGIFFLIQLAFIKEQLFYLSPNKFSNSWAYPAKKAYEITRDSLGIYDHVVISAKIDNSEYAYETYSKLDPSVAVSEYIRTTTGKENNYKVFGNVYIASLSNSEKEPFMKKIGGHNLFIGDPLADVEKLTGYETIVGLKGDNILLIKSY